MILTLLFYPILNDISILSFTQNRDRTTLYITVKTAGKEDIINNLNIFSKNNIVFYKLSLVTC